METATWNCCRMCLSKQNLYPIFIDVQHHEKYSNVIYMVSGIKVDLKDNLPKEICSTCINHINESTKFRKRCEETNLQLLNHVNDKQMLIKTETSQIKQETQTTIDITHLLEDFDDEFKDYDDNITLDSLQFHNSIAKTDNDSNKINCDTFVNSIENVEKKVSKKADCRPKRKLKGSKKENNVTSEKEKQREEIQCEYCHKVLTSRLSLRNHYKIHTGFDIVCEHCGKKFINKRLLLMHCKAKHGYEKTDKCSFCDYKASNAEQVKIHERLHTGEKPFVCSDCGAGFHRKSSYLQHVAIHLPEKTVQCEKCPARFKSVTLMRIHANRHRAPTYSFECRICDGSFARRRNVARHLQRVHGLPPSQQHIERRKIV